MAFNHGEKLLWEYLKAKEARFSCRSSKFKVGKMYEKSVYDHEI